jgi:hypothetical protein
MNNALITFRNNFPGISITDAAYVAEAENGGGGGGFIATCGLPLGLGHATGLRLW